MRKFNPQAFTEKAVKFLQDYLAEHKIEKVILGLSGGLDSAVVYNLAVRAVGQENVIAVALPNGNQGAKSLQDAYRVVFALDWNIRYVIDISSMVDAFRLVLKTGDAPLRTGNIAARVRMVVLYDTAAKEGGIVLGTENKTEHYLGYFTRWGDEASDIELIRDLYKTEVRDLARYLGVPDEIIDKPPSADLWEGQTDEEELGISYETADLIIDQLLQGKQGSQIAGKPFKASEVRHVEKLMDRVEYKIRKVPYPRV